MNNTKVNEKLAELVDMIPEGELVNFESILGDTLVITKEDVHYLYVII